METKPPLAPLAERKAAARAAEHEYTRLCDDPNATASERVDAWTKARDLNAARRSYVEDHVVMEWRDVPENNRYIAADGKKMIFGMEYATGATILAPWTGPKGA